MSEWIPVTDRLPTCDPRTRRSKKVLVFCTDKRHRVDEYEMLPAHPQGGEWRTLRNSAMARPTHWQDLPESPVAPAADTSATPANA